MKHLATSLILLMCCFSVIGAPAHTETSKNVGVLWVGKASMQDRVLKGFMQRIRVLAPSIHVEVKPRLKGFEEASFVVDRYAKQKDAIVFLRSSGAKFLASYSLAIPAFIGGCNNPVSLGVTSSLSSPDKGITGVTYYLPYEQHFSVIEGVFKNLKTIGLLLEKGHPGSAIDAQGTKVQTEARGITLHTRFFTSKSELLSETKNLKSKVDLFITGSQALIFENVKDVVKYAGKIPVVSYSGKSVEDGALFGLVPDDNKLGLMLADSVVDVLINNIPISQVPIKTDPAPELRVNKEMQQFHKVEIDAVNP